MARHTIGKTAVVVGNTLTGPLKAGEIVQPGAVAPTASGVTNGVQVSMSLPIARAVGGSLAAGETVDVVATEKGAFKARTVASGAVIISAQSASNASLGTGGDTVVTLSVPTRDEAIAIAGAIDTGTVTLVRTTGSQPTIDTPIINEAITNRASGS